MRTFTIDCDNNIAVYAAPEEVPPGDNIHRFTSEKELGKVLELLSGDELVQLWNSFAGVAPFTDLKPVKKFTNRKTAVVRVWKAVQRLDAAPAPQAAHGAPKGGKSRKAAKAKDGTHVAREGSKKAIVLDLLKRPAGATMAEIAEATKWQPHSIRGFISGTAKKMGLTIESSKNQAGDRRYRVTK